MAALRDAKGLLPEVRLGPTLTDPRVERVADGRIAVIDIGSNSIRLVAFQGLQRVPIPIFNEKVFCGLARGLSQTGRLDGEGVELALKNLERFTKLAQAMDLEKVSMLATAAVREAEDGPDFVAEVKRRCGLSVKVLDGEEEGRLSAEGVIAGTPMADGIMGDLGGGSLEVVRIRQGRVAELATLPLGSLRLLGQKQQDAKSQRKTIDRVLDDIPWLGAEPIRDFYAVGGSWRALARISIESRNHPLKVIHGYVMSRDELDSLARVISRQTKDSLSRIKAVSSRRLETLPLAALVLRRLLRRVRPEEVMFSAYGLREGWLFNQLSEEEQRKDPLLEVARDVAERDGRFGDLGPELYDWTTPLFEQESAEERRLRRAACHLSDMAWREHPDYRASWALHRLLQWPFLAADHRERAFLSQAVSWRYGSCSEAEPYRILLEPAQAWRSKVLGLALRLAYTLSAGTAAVLQTSDLYWDKGRLGLHLPKDGPVPSGDVVERRFSQLVEAAEASAAGS